MPPIEPSTAARLRDGDDPDAVRTAGRVLRSGGLVAFPTETVYGLGADARNAAAVAGIFRAKGRPGDNPLIVHLPDAAAVECVARMTPLARRLAARWWPGPLTVVLDARPGLPPATTAGLPTVGLRVPDHPVALDLLTAAGMPVAAPSANRSGRPSPTTAQHVLADLGDAVDLVLDGGPCRIGVESTVVDARGTDPVVLREGAVTREQLQAAEQAVRAGDPAALASSPGTRHRHYAPACPVVLAPPGRASAEAARLAGAGRRVGLVAAHGSAAPPGHGVEELARYGDVAQLGRLLYQALREADARGLDACVVETVDEVGLGRAVMDRLRRAATGSGGEAL